MVFLKQVKYSVDAIDESDIIEEILKPRIGMINGSLEKITINGNHHTLCTGKTCLNSKVTIEKQKTNNMLSMSFIIIYQT